MTGQFNTHLSPDIFLHYLHFSKYNNISKTCVAVTHTACTLCLTKYKQIQSQQWGGRLKKVPPHCKNAVIKSQIRYLKALLYSMCWPYRSVEVALAVHGNVEPRLGALDGHYPEPHRNQVELHCRKKQTGRSGVRAIILFLKRSKCFLVA